MQKLLLFILTISFVACGQNQSSPSNSQAQGPGGLDPAEFSGQPGDCKEFISKLPSTYFYDWIDVPENPSEPSGKQIRVFFYGKKQLTDNVVAFYNGGPGSDSHGSHRALDRKSDELKITDKISFIYIDQRGTGCSSPFPFEKTDANIEHSKHYGSRGIVYDSEAIRKKLLGNKPWRIFGQSFGAFVVHRYVSLFPESIDKAYAHANTLNHDPMERITFRILSQYRVLQLYFQLYPEDHEKLKTLNNLLTATTCVTTQFNGEVCGHEVLGELVTYLGFSNQWPNLHKLIADLVRQDQTLDTEALKEFILSIDEESSPTGYAINVISLYDRNVASSNTENCSEVYSRIEAMGIPRSEILISECAAAVQTKFSSKLSQYVKEKLGGASDFLTIDQLRAGINRMKSKSFYLYSGERDTFVPKESFLEELNLIQDIINYTHFLSSGHEGYRTEEKVWQDLISR